MWLVFLLRSAAKSWQHYIKIYGCGNVGMGRHQPSNYKGVLLTMYEAHEGLMFLEVIAEIKISAMTILRAFGRHTYVAPLRIM